jgi:hypothetical protein
LYRRALNKSAKGKVLNNQKVAQPRREVNETRQVESFPLDVLPLPIRRFVEGIAQSVGCPVDFPAVAALVACSCAVGASRALRVKKGWLEMSNLYVALVGDGGLGKSPAMWATILRSWGGDANNGARQIPIALTTDATLEALQLALRDNAHGVLYAADALEGLFQALNKYRNGKGNDRQALEVLWGGGAAIAWRTRMEATRQLDSIDVGRPWLSILGTTTPEGLARLGPKSGEPDGLLERFLFCFPQASRSVYTERGLDPEVHDKYWAVLDSLYRLQETVRESEILEMSVEGATEWAQYARWHSWGIRGNVNAIPG